MKEFETKVVHPELESAAKLIFRFVPHSTDWKNHHLPLDLEVHFSFLFLDKKRDRNNYGLFWMVFKSDLY